ncbi:endodeoxyribonuclease [Rhizobium sp. XQZ8]|uniref:endodeoxyribonuclease n=1 Tax=Rhizobium populisoli TaxID=2859785 RepID=UPI001CA4D73B|nr:endodeoxyribonuclease [Rhizobium populisoli]MBW6426109.1 endodeoxyribonuclease [Rhizobium populisoli]
MGPKFQYEAERLSYTVQKKYLPDWIDAANKRNVEAKGLFTAEDRANHKAIRAQYPDWEVTIIFQKADRKITKTSKSSYADRCDGNGIKWKQA